MQISIKNLKDYIRKQKRNKFTKKTQAEKIFENRCGNCNYIHDSKMEKQYCNQIEIILKTGGYKDILYQIKVPLYGLKGNLICNHIVDFCIVKNNNVKEWHEVKGYETPDYKLKYKLFKDNYPDRIYKKIKEEDIFI